MRNNLVVSLILAALIVSPAAWCFMPFAPGADIPANPENDPALAGAIQHIRELNIPEKEEVGLPAYPDAVAIQTVDGHGEVLPMVRLLTSDDITMVTDFYKSKLTDWNYREYSGTHRFWKGDEINAGSGKIPNLRIEEAKSYHKLMPSAMTVIGIWYKP